MSKKIDRIGMKFGRLTVVELVETRRNSVFYYKCLCDCGNEIIAKGTHLGRAINSCGCLKKEIAKETNTKHGMKYTKFYECWHHMKQRCNNISDDNNKRNYKDRGITYDPRWEEFINFKQDMYFSYIYAKKQLRLEKPSIERKDVNGNYCKDNCTWIEFNEQNNNKRTTVNFIAIDPDGNVYKDKNYKKFAREHGLSHYCIYHCLKGNQDSYKGWNFKVISDENLLKVAI